MPQPREVFQDTAPCLPYSPHPDLIQVLTEAGVTLPTELPSATRQIIPFYRAGAETFLAVWEVATVTGPIFVAQKTVVTFTDPVRRARELFQRLCDLRSWGIPIPVLYGIHATDIYEEFLSGARPADEVLRAINPELSPQKFLLEQLANIATILDTNGFNPVGPFWRNLLLARGTLYLTDAGFDLGGANPARPVTVSMDALQKKFPNYLI